MAILSPAVSTKGPLPNGHGHTDYYSLIPATHQSPLAGSTPALIYLSTPDTSIHTQAPSSHLHKSKLGSGGSERFTSSQQAAGRPLKMASA